MYLNTKSYNYCHSTKSRILWQILYVLCHSVVLNLKSTFFYFFREPTSSSLLEDTQALLQKNPSGGNSSSNNNSNSNQKTPTRMLVRELSQPSPTVNTKVKFEI